VLGEAKCHMPCSHHENSRNCFSHVKVNICSRNPSYKGNKGYDCAPPAGSGPTPGCVSYGSCSAPDPACGKITTGVDDCGKECTRKGPICPPGSCGDGVCNGTENCAICADCTCPAGCDMFEERCNCNAVCTGLLCGPPPGCVGPGWEDGCGGCNPGWTCTPTVGCLCDTGCTGKNCGADNCTPPGSCGTCAASEVCALGGVCISCTPDCAGKACVTGDDGCGGKCTTNCCGDGSCDPAHESPGTCPSDCLNQCSGKPDGDPCDYGLGGTLCTPATCQGGFCGGACTNGDTKIVGVGFWINAATSVYCGCDAGGTPGAHWRYKMACTGGQWVNTGPACTAGCSGMCTGCAPYVCPGFP
jgi:hypothetical protein